jgi:sterol desaturase/sphingolipid hydroxylase (fatty acid hydroxylase superfamily)
MAFRYTRPPLTQNAVAFVVIAAVAGLMSLPGADAAWQRYLAATPDWFHFIGAVYVIHGVVFWGLSAAFFYVERHNKPAFIARYRIQDDTKKRPSRGRVAWVLACNQLFWTPVVLLGIDQALDLRGWSDSGLPSIGWFLGALAGLTVASTVYFYASHRFLHRPWWFKNVHRVHHEYRTSTAIAAEYAHWFEFVFGNFGTMGFGVVLLAPSLPTIYTYALLGTYTFVVHHSGFAVPWYSWAVHHDWHHYRYREAFGTYGVLDRLLDTDMELRELKDGQEVR